MRSTVVKETGLHAEQEGFEFQNVKETDVKCVIKSLATNKPSGYIKISARVLKDSCESIAPVIFRLVNSSFQMAAFSKAWKIAWKIGNSEELANNRPISLLPGHSIESKWKTGTQAVCGIF